MTTPPAHRPLYEQVADALRQQVERGELAPGDAIPSEAVLRARFGVSRETVRRALARLTQEGLLAGGQGRPRTVRHYAPLRWPLSEGEGRPGGDDVPDASLDAWASEVRRQGHTPSESIEVSIVVPPPEVAERLGISDRSATVVVRRRVRYVDDTPYQLADSYFPEELARGSLLMKPESVFVPGGVLAAIGRPQVRYVDEIAVRMPRPAESERLDLPGGTPVAELVRTGYGEDGAPLRVMVSVAPGDRNVLHYELDAG